MARWKTSRRWTPGDAREAIDAWQKSGTSLARFAAAHRLAPLRLQRWRRRLEAVSEPSVPRVMQVRVVAREPNEETDAMDIVLRDGLLVRVRPGFDAESVASLISALSAC